MSEIDALVPKHDSPLINSSCWINFGHARTLMHYDGMDNWLCQIQGRKRVLLFPPEDRDYLYTFNKEPHSIISKIEKLQNSTNPFIIINKNKLDPNFIEKAIEVLGKSSQYILPNDKHIVPPAKSKIM